MKNVLNEKGTTMVTVIVSFVVLMVTILMFQQCVKTALSFAQRAAVKNSVSQKAFETVMEQDRNKQSDITINIKFKSKTGNQAFDGKMSASYGKATATASNGDSESVVYFN